MAKRITYTITRDDPNTPWYHETEEKGDSWQTRINFMYNHSDVITTYFTETDTTFTSVVEISDDTVYEEFVSLTSDVVPKISQYVDENPITYTITTEDI